MNENNRHQFQPPDEFAPLTLADGLLARLGLDESPRSSESSSESPGKAISDPVWMVRIAAIEALAHRSDQQSLQWLLAALHDEDESVRACAARVLGAREDTVDSAVIEHLEATMHDPAWHVRETAIYALGMMQSLASLPALKTMLADEDAQVRLAGTRVIERLESIAHDEQQENVIEERQDMADQHIPAASRTAETARKHVSTRRIRPSRPWLRVLEQVMAAILVLGIAISWFAINHLTHLSSGTPAVFNDANVRPLGAPTYTIQGNLSYLEQWSGDGHTFYYLQVDTPKQTLQVGALDATTGHTTIYPVLDSSWIHSLHRFNIDLIDHYLLALRPQGRNTATMEIWDITRQRTITAQTVPATVGVDGQIVSPVLVPSENGQKLAVFPPNGVATIWDLASGHKLATLEGKAPYVDGVPPLIKWFNHDQSLLFLGRSNASGAFEPSVPETWNTTTGARLFNLKDSNRTYLGASISPDGQYLALSSRQQQSASSLNGTTLTPDMLEIIDVHSGQVLRTYHLNVSDGTGAGSIWLSDSHHLLTQYVSGNSNTGLQKLQIRIWNAFTGQTTFETSSSGTETVSTTPDGQYLIRSGPNSRSMQIWQTSSGRLIATLTTPGIYPNPFSFSDINSQYILIGSKSSFDIWDTATGKLLYKYQGFTPFTADGNGGSNVFWSLNRKYLTMVAWKTSLINGSDDGVITIWRMP